MIKIMNKNNTKHHHIQYNTISYGFHPTIFGECLIAAAANKNTVCHLSFVNKYNKRELLNILRKEYPDSILTEDMLKTEKIINDVFLSHDSTNANYDENESSIKVVRRNNAACKDKDKNDMNKDKNRDKNKGNNQGKNRIQEVKILLNGSDFQIKVWQALVSIPFGTTVSYQFVANTIGRPTAVRAVATAIAKNKIAYLIPCHRVISKSGKLNKYRWGNILKQKLLAAENEIIVIPLSISQ